MCAAQNDSAIDMLMYYDARPSHYNGLFDLYTNEPLKGYYPFKMFNTLYRMGNACHCDVVGEGLYAAAACDGERSALMVAYFNDDDEDTSTSTVILDLVGGTDEYTLYLLDEQHDATEVAVVRVGDALKLRPNTVCLLVSRQDAHSA
jgi:hypothetical protein